MISLSYGGLFVPGIRAYKYNGCSQQIVSVLYIYDSDRLVLTTPESATAVTITSWKHPHAQWFPLSAEWGVYPLQIDNGASRLSDYQFIY